MSTFFWLAAFCFLYTLFSLLRNLYLLLRSSTRLQAISLPGEEIAPHTQHSNDLLIAIGLDTPASNADLESGTFQSTSGLLTIRNEAATEMEIVAAPQRVDNQEIGNSTHIISLGHGSEVNPPNTNVARNSRNDILVTIGIDNYAKQPLSFAASDADKIEHLFQSCFGLLKENIISLRNEQATGDAIRTTLQRVADDPNIVDGSTLFLYIAGHGTTVNAPSNWHTRNGKRQMFLPQDFDFDLPDDVKGSWTQRGRGILDAELGHMFRIIVAKKRLSIIGIFDYCHSGSGTRGSSNLTVRGYNLPSDYALPTDPIPPWLSDFPTGYSHIRLAACHKDQLAYEDRDWRSGYFTHAVVDILRKTKENGKDMKTFTYQDLFSEMAHSRYGFNQKEHAQTPQIEGVDTACVIFTRDLLPSRSVIYSVEMVDDGFQLKGGTESNITDGAEFGVYMDKRLTSESRVASIRAHRVASFVTHCSLLSTNSESLADLPRDKPLYAVEILYGQRLRLFIDQGDPHYDQFNKMILDWRPNEISIRSIDIVGPNQEADIFISTEMSGDTVAFEHRNPTFLRDSGMTRLKCGSGVSVKDKGLILQILIKTVHYFRLLDLPKMGNYQGPSLDIKCQQIRREDYNGKEYIVKQNARNLHINKNIYIDTADQNTAYAFEIKNNSTSAYDVAVFMFNSNLDILRYDLPVTQVLPSNPTFPSLLRLPPGQTLRIGTGDGGVPPRQFNCPSGQNTDISYLKVLTSSKTLNFSGIAQKDVFRNGASRTDAGEVNWQLNNEDTFESLTIPVIQGDAAWLKAKGMP